MKQKLFFKNYTLWKIKNKRNPTVWECGRKYQPDKGDYVEVNRKPID